METVKSTYRSNFSKIPKWLKQTRAFMLTKPENSHFLDFPVFRFERYTDFLNNASSLFPYITVRTNGSIFFNHVVNFCENPQFIPIANINLNFGISLTLKVLKIHTSMEF